MTRWLSFLLPLLLMGCASLAPGTGSPSIAFQEIQTVSAHTTPAAATNMDSISATYPDLALRANVEGNIQLNVKLSATGAVEDVKVWRGIGAGCDEEAWRMTRALTFRPAQQDGTPVASEVQVIIRFRLR